MVDTLIISICIFIALLLLILIGFPIVFSLGILALILVFIFWGPKGLYMFATASYGQINSFSLISIPLFILMAEIILQSEISSRAYNALTKWIGWIPGGLIICSIGACALFGAVCGAGTATTATIGKIAVPEMLKRKYEPKMALGSVAAAGALGSLIPPSIYMILYGTLTERSIGKLFIGGIIPGVMIAAMFSIYIIIKCKLDPKLAPSLKGFSWKERFISFSDVWEIALLIVFLFISLYRGLATASEVAGVGCFVAFATALIRRKLTWKKLGNALLDTCTTSCFIGWILVSASAFGYVLSYMQIPQNISSWMVALPVSRYVVLTAINLILIVLGCFMNPAAIILITVPIFAPIVSELGFDLIWFGVAIVINMLIAQITPPLGLNLYIIRNVAPSVRLEEIIIGTLPFLIIELIALTLVIIWPEIILWLPSKMIF